MYSRERRLPAPQTYEQPLAHFLPPQYNSGVPPPLAQTQPLPPTAIPDKYPNIQYGIVVGRPYGTGATIFFPIQYSLLSLLMLRKPGFANALRPTPNKLMYIIPDVDSAVFVHFMEWVYTGEYGPPNTRMPRVPRHPLPNQTIVPGPRQFYDSPFNPWKHPIIVGHIAQEIIDVAKHPAAWLALNISMAILCENWALEKSHYPRSTNPSNSDGSVTIPDDISLAQLARYKLAMQSISLQMWVEVYIPTVYRSTSNDSCLRVYTRSGLDPEERIAMRKRICDVWNNDQARPLFSYWKTQFRLLHEDIRLLFAETNDFPGMATPEGVLD